MATLTLVRKITEVGFPLYYQKLKGHPAVESIGSYVADTLGISLKSVMGYDECYEMSLYSEYDYSQSVEPGRKTRLAVELSHGKSVFVEFEGDFNELCSMASSYVEEKRSEPSAAVDPMAEAAHGMPIVDSSPVFSGEQLKLIAATVGKVESFEDEDRIYTAREICAEYGEITERMAEAIYHHDFGEQPFPTGNPEVDKPYLCRADDALVAAIPLIRAKIVREFGIL